MNSNISGYGGLVWNCDGKPLLGYTGMFEQKLVVWLEMFALFHGLVVAKNLGITKLRVNLDSKVEIDIVNNKRKCPWRVLSLKEKITNALKEFEHTDIYHVWREANQPVDILSNWATSPDEQLLYPEVFSPSLVEAICKDVNQHVYARL